MKSSLLPGILSGKKILLIGVKFYHFNAEIIKKLEGYGAEVNFFYERDISVKHAIVANFFSSYIDEWQRKHYNSILKDINNDHYDYLFVIRGYKMEGQFIEKVRFLNPGIKTIMYQWDSNKNGSYESLLKHFDSVRTFDYKDSEDFHIKYIPTFHTDEFNNLPEVSPRYKLFFYGNFTLDRYNQMLDLKKYADMHGITLKTHLHISWKRYLIQRLKGVNINSKYVTFQRMDKETYIKIFNQSEIIVDFTTDAQTGLAMRVVDVLGAGKKLITNNVHIVKEPTYNPEQILIVDLNNFNIPKSFLEHKQFKKQDYSIDKWLERVFVE
ncbi:MAG: hypothetical protein V4687_01805 [Bacteroidota bacterium]